MNRWQDDLKTHFALLVGVLVFAVVAGGSLWYLSFQVGQGKRWAVQLHAVDRLHGELSRLPGESQLGSPADAEGAALLRWLALASARLDDYRRVYRQLDEIGREEGGFGTASAVRQQLSEAGMILRPLLDPPQDDPELEASATQKAETLHSVVRQLHHSLVGAIETQRDRLLVQVRRELQAQRFGIWALRAMAIAIAIGIVSIAVVAIRVIGRAREQLADLRRSAEAVAEGDYEVEIPELAGDGELERLARAMHRLVLRTLGAIEELKRGSQQIDGTAQNLLQASRDQTSAATEQASSLRETSAMVDELARTSWHIAQSTTEVSDRAQQALSSAQQGQGAVEQVRTNMKEILRKSHANSERITALGDWSERIGDFIELIDHIAEQTNLLALNASVEAARAGEGGEGFAIVANEIRQLSENVGRSTQQIRQLVVDIQSATTMSIQAVDEEVALVQRGMELALQANQSLEAIVSTIDQTAKTTRSISVSTQQQKQANEQAATSVRELTTVTQGWASGARQTTSYATDLATLARRFRRTLQYFRLPAEGSFLRREVGASEASHEEDAS
ncbi:MAG: methyl-accepting chemotaxis protein [Planctomycetota bacterium]